VLCRLPVLNGYIHINIIYICIKKHTSSGPTVIVIVTVVNGVVVVVVWALVELVLLFACFKWLYPYKYNIYMF
jgi:hypothetical protein